MEALLLTWWRVLFSILHGDAGKTSLPQSVEKSSTLRPWTFTGELLGILYVAVRGPVLCHLAFGAQAVLTYGGFIFWRAERSAPWQSSAATWVPSGKAVSLSES